MISPPETPDDEDAVSLNDVATADVRRSMASGSPPGPSGPLSGIAAGAQHAGWTMCRPGSSAAGMKLLGSNALMLQDQNVLQDLSNVMVEQLSKMYAHCEVLLDKQRARHSSDLSLMLRRVDKDLKDTYRSVRETFVTMTQQVMALLREVQSGRDQVTSIQGKFEAAVSMAEMRAQYVEELEAVLDGQTPGASEALRKLSDEIEVMKKEFREAAAEAEAREQALSGEIRTLRARLRRLEAEQAQTIGPQPPMLPEMAATWTRRASPPPLVTSPAGAEGTSPPGYGDEFRPAPSSTGSASPPGPRCSSRGSATGTRTPTVDIVGSTLKRSDDSRAVSRSKCVHPPAGRVPEHRSPALAAKAAAREAHRENRATEELKRQKREKDLERHAKLLEERAARQHKLIESTSPSFQLLRDIFNELRQHWRFQQSAEPDSGDAGKERPLALLTLPGSARKNPTAEEKEARKAADLLDRIVRFFYEATPKMGNFQELFTLVAEEAARPLPKAVAKGIEVEGDSALTISQSPIQVVPERTPLDRGQYVFGEPRTRRMAATMFPPMPEGDEDEGVSQINGFPPKSHHGIPMEEPFSPRRVGMFREPGQDSVGPLRQPGIAEMRGGAFREPGFGVDPMGMPPLQSTLMGSPLEVTQRPFNRQSHSPAFGRRLIVGPSEGSFAPNTLRPATPI